MASFQKRTNSDGSKAVIAWVRIRPFKPATKAFPDLKAAKAWATAQETELRRQKQHGDVRKDLPTLTLGGLIKEYLDDPETQALKSYEKTIAPHLEWWLSHYASEKVFEFGPVKLREARELLSNGRQNGTVNRYLSDLRSCWNWGRAAGFIPQERGWPTRLLLSEPKGRSRYLNDFELKAVLDAAQKHSTWLHAAIVVSLATGLRQGELLRLKWEDIDFENKSVSILITKADKPRVVHLPAPAVNALKKLKGDGAIKRKRVFEDDGTPVNKNYLAWRWKQIRKAAGLTNADFRWHDLRHSCASFLAQNGASLLEIGSVLGHSSPSVTQRYSHLIAGKAVTGADKLAEKLA